VPDLSRDADRGSKAGRAYGEGGGVSIMLRSRAAIFYLGGERLRCKGYSLLRSEGDWSCEIELDLRYESRAFSIVTSGVMPCVLLIPRLLLGRVWIDLSTEKNRAILHCAGAGLLDYFG
jgi:hypothetical protein